MPAITTSVLLFIRQFKRSTHKPKKTWEISQKFSFVACSTWTDSKLSISEEKLRVLYFHSISLNEQRCFRMIEILFEKIEMENFFVAQFSGISSCNWNSHARFLCLLAIKMYNDCDYYYLKTFSIEIPTFFLLALIES